MKLEDLKSHKTQVERQIRRTKNKKELNRLKIELEYTEAAIAAEENDDGFTDGLTAATRNLITQGVGDNASMEHRGTDS